MSRTFSSCARERSAKGYARRTSSMQLGHLDLLVGADRDDVLREDVERVARDLRLLDQPLPHPLRDDRRLEQVGAELREDPPARDLAERVAGAADPLQAAGDRLRRLDLDHEVDGAHVDPELERRGRDEARDPARLQVLLDLRPLLARERTVVRARNLLLRELVEPQREPLGETAVVDEDDRRAVRTDELDQRRVDRGPDRARLVALPRGSPRARACPRRGRRPRGRAPSPRRRRRARSGGHPRRTCRSPRAGAASPRGRSAAAAAPRAPRAARPRARDGRRASCRRPRAPRRGSACRRCAAARVRAR